MRAFLLERGISFHTGRAHLRRHLPELLENTNEKLTARLRRLLDLLWQEWQHLEIQIESLTEQIEQIANQDEAFDQSNLGQWIAGLEGRAARNVLIVAVANKLARISWAVLSSGEGYRFRDAPMPISL